NLSAAELISFFYVISCRKLLTWPNSASAPFCAEGPRWTARCMALGARPANILSLPLKQGVLLTGIGVVVGLVAALILTRLMASLLFGVTSTDAITYLGVSALLAAVAIFATYVPARRATQVDPIKALRYE